MIVKGLPIAGAHPIDVRGKNVLNEEFPTPVAVLKADTIGRNVAWMQEFSRSAGVDLAPHGKTIMSPELLSMIVDSGVWGLTCATCHHLEVYRNTPVRRVLFANQIVGAANLAMALRHVEDPNFELFTLVDSRQGVDRLAEGSEALGLKRRVSVLIEVGATGQRTGVRRQEEGLDLARYVAGNARLSLRGVETFEGVFGHHPPEVGLACADGLLRDAVRLAEAIDQAGLWGEGEVILSAGGSDFFDLAAAALTEAKLSTRSRVVLRSGCVITQDHLHYADAFERIASRRLYDQFPSGELTPALEVWAHVQSIPEPGLAICNVGKRDISYDWQMPVPVRWRPRAGGLRSMPQGFEVSALNDQHLFLRGPAEAMLRIGDMIAFGVSHPCTTFDKWKSLVLVDEEYLAVGTVSTSF